MKKMEQELMKNKIIEKIEGLIECYMPYRSTTDSSEMQEVRKVLAELNSFIQNLNSEEEDGTN